MGNKHKELADYIRKGHGDEWMFPKTGKPVFKEDDLRKHQLISFTSVLGKVMEQIILEQ